MGSSLEIRMNRVCSVEVPQGVCIAETARAEELRLSQRFRMGFTIIAELECDAVAHKNRVVKPFCVNGRVNVAVAERLNSGGFRGGWHDHCFFAAAAARTKQKGQYQKDSQNSFHIVILSQMTDEYKFLF